MTHGQKNIKLVWWC